MILSLPLFKKKKKKFLKKKKENPERWAQTWVGGAGNWVMGIKEGM